MSKKKFTSEKIAIYLSLGLHEGNSKLEKKPSAPKREHPALKNFKFRYFFLFLWVIFVFLVPDPSDQNQCGSGSETQCESLKKLTYMCVGGVYLKVDQLAGLLQYLIWVFLPAPPLRKMLGAPPPVK